MVKERIAPRSCAVASLTSGRETGLLVVRVRGSVVVLHVATRTGGAGQVVIAVDVALLARQSGVRPGQWEPSVVVIEAGISPRGGVVANLAGRRDPGLLVIRIGRAVVVLGMTGHAGGIFEVVIAVDVALRTRRGRMFPGQRESGRRVIEAGISP